MEIVHAVSVCEASPRACLQPARLSPPLPTPPKDVYDAFSTLFDNPPPGIAIDEIGFLMAAPEDCSLQVRANLGGQGNIANIAT